MGGRSSRVEYRTDPATLRALEAQRAQLASITQELAAAREEAKRRSDPKLFKQSQKEIFARFITGLKDMSFTSAIPAELQVARNVLVIGDVSSGKSSLLNALFGLHLAVGVGHTTTEVTPVHNDGRTIVWDSPGGNRDFAFYDPTALNFIYGASFVVVLYKTSISTVDDIVNVVKAIKKDTSAFVCVRTQCDLHDATRDALSIDQEMARDRDFLAARGLGGVRLLKTAARGSQPFENAALLQLMTLGA